MPISRDRTNAFLRTCPWSSSGGQYLRVGKAITTADAIIGGAAQPLTSTTLAPMPTAAAVAAAAATAKIQSMEVMTVVSIWLS